MGEQGTDTIRRLEDRIAWLECEAAQANCRAATAQGRIDELEGEIRYFRERFTGDLLVEIADRFKRFVDDRELVGMTNDEFNYELHQLLFS